MAGGFPGAGPRTILAPAPVMPRGDRVQQVQSIYDFHIYLMGGKFRAIHTGTHISLGDFPTQSLAVKAVIASYEAAGLPRYANPREQLLDLSRPLGYNTPRGTSK